MRGIFHWLRFNIFCYATENEELIHDSMEELLGTDDFECDVTNSEHGNRLIIFSAELSKQKDMTSVFQRLGKQMTTDIISNLDNMIDDSCVFYLRLDKQDFVQGRYEIAHHGDVLSMTGKVASHPAKKEIAIRNMKEFLSSLEFPEEGSLP